MKKTFLFLAEGFEDIEAIAVVDVLRRGGVEVQTVSITDHRQVKSAHGVEVLADLTIDEITLDQAECLICPGGMPGAKHLAETSMLVDFLQRQYENGQYIAAICAAPALVFSRLKMDNLRMTCYPGFENVLPSHFELSDEGVVVDGKVITAQGPGFAVSFGLMILEKLRSSIVAKEVAQGMLLDK